MQKWVLVCILIGAGVAIVSGLWATLSILKTEHFLTEADAIKIVKNAYPDQFIGVSSTAKFVFLKYNGTAFIIYAAEPNTRQITGEDQPYIGILSSEVKDRFVWNVIVHQGPVCDHFYSVDAQNGEIVGAYDKPCIWG